MQALLLGSPAQSQKVWIIKSVQVQEGEKYNPTLLRSRCQDLWILKGKVYLLKFLGHFRHQLISFLARLEMARPRAATGRGRGTVPPLALRPAPTHYSQTDLRRFLRCSSSSSPCQHHVPLHKPRGWLRDPQAEPPGAGLWCGGDTGTP